MEKRNLFDRMFGKKTVATNGKRYELISTSDSSFVPWNGNLFANDIVRAAIRPKANAVGKLNAKHITGSGESMKINKVPYIRNILQTPNPFMSMQDFLIKMTFMRELDHNAFAYIKRDDNGYPLEVYPIPATSVEMIEQDEDVYVKFRFNTGKFVVIHYADIIHLRKDFYANDMYGESGYPAISSLMEIITTTDQGVVNAVRTSAVIKWLMKFKQVLQPTDVEIQLKNFTDKYLSISNTGGAAAVDPRYDLEQVKNENFVPNAAQMDKTVQRLYSYFGVNDAIVQNKYDEDQFNAFYESEIEPMAIQLSNAFTSAFFSVRERASGNRIVFESSNLQYASMGTKLGLVAMVDRGAMTPNEWRTVLNLGPIEGGEKPIRRLDTATVDNQKPKEGNDGNKPT